MRKLKSIIEWLISMVLKLRLRRTYWSIAVPLGLLVIGEFAKKLDLLVKATNSLYESSEGFWTKLLWKAVNLYLSIDLPWWTLGLFIAMLLLFTYVYIQELKVKKSGQTLTASVIINRIFPLLSKKIDDKIDEFKSQFVFQPKRTWFEEQSMSSIHDLGKRYTPELNVELEISEIFDGLGRTSNFKKKTTKLFDQLLINGKKILKEKPEVKTSIEQLESSFDKLYDLFESINFHGTISLPTNEIEMALVDAGKRVDEIYDFYISEERKLQKEKDDYKYYHKYGTELRNIREFEQELSSFIKFINSSTFKLANNPFLILDGEAGIGKSHLIGDVVSERITNGYDSVFLLGQHFVTEEDPWTQIFKRLQINSKSGDFLHKLNEHAERTGKRIVLFIDAINEGKGKYFWNNFVKSFINEIKKYDWLGLVLTIRTSYNNLVFPSDEKVDLDMVEHHHNGFSAVEYEASKLFFENYKIELPNVPLLHPEFQNPLFLKLFCEGISKAGLSRIPDGLQGITSIIDFFVKNVNEVLSKPSKIGYSNSLNLVRKSIYALIEYKVDNQLRYVSYESAYKVIEEKVSTFIEKKGFIDELIIEGVLSKNLFWKEDGSSEEGIYLAYERFDDHLTVQYLLNQFQELESEFLKDGKLHHFVEDENALYFNKGIIDAFSIQVPEETGREFFTFIPWLKDQYPIVESFVESLLWRKVKTINDESKKYVNEHVFSYRETHDLFWETILAITAIPGHYFNALSLHNHLFNQPLAERDANWTVFLKYRFSNESSIKRLIDWARSQTDKSHVSDESIKLSSVALLWLHTSTNRELRDYATKALVSLLQDRLDVLITVMKMFEGVNDLYVYERLFAVAYGAALRTRKPEELIKLSEYVFETIFNNMDGVIPHILLRDYARGVIEYSEYLGFDLDIDLSMVRPPYKSVWPEDIPSYDVLKENYDNDQYWDLWSSVMGFGDFARYTIGTNSSTSEWSGCRIGESPIDRKLLFENFKKELNPKQLELLDRMNPIIMEDSDKEPIFIDGKVNIKIAVGRKTEEELNKIKHEFKNSLTSKLLANYEKEIEPYLDHNHNIINTGRHFDLRIAQRLVFSRVITLGWNPELHLSFDKKIGTGRGRSTNPHERIGKKYQWIAYHEYLALLSDNYVKYERWGMKEKEKPYEGPWDPYVRDIDPTMLINTTGSYNSENPQDYWWTKNQFFDWSCSNEEWTKDDKDFPPFEGLIEVKDTTDQKWLVLEGYPSWSEPKKIGEEKWNQPHKEFWCQIRSYIVKDSDYEKFKNWAKHKNFMGRWMPESGSRYEVFSREYYSSPAHEYFMKEYYGGDEWTEVYDRELGESIANVNITTIDFLWEEEFDNSKEQTISFLKPSTVIYRGMGLRYGDREGEFISDSGELQCFAANVHHDSKSYLLIKRESFSKFLSENNLKIVWTILGEKQIMGGSAFGTDFPGRVEISGSYYFDQDELRGNLNTKIV